MSRYAARITMLSALLISILFSNCTNKFFKTHRLKKTADSSADSEQMLKNEFKHPLRDSSVIAVKIEGVYPEIRKALSNIDMFLTNRKKVRISLTIAPDGKIAIVSLLDSIKIDSLSMTELKNSLALSVCEPIENDILYTKTVLLVNRINNLALVNPINVDTKIQIETIENVEMRLKSSIMKVVEKGLIEIQAVYNERLRNPITGDGRITVKFLIDEYGGILRASIIKSTFNDSEFEEKLLDIVKSWNFGKIFNPGNIDEVIFPFVFTK